MKGKRQPLGRFLDSNKISLSRLARESGYSRDHLTNVREGRAHPSLECVRAILDACGRVTGRDVDVAELFDVRPRRKAS